MSAIRVAYAGYDRRTLELLAADPEIELVAANVIKELAAIRCKNPIDLLFALPYALRRGNR